MLAVNAEEAALCVIRARAGLLDDVHDVAGDVRIEAEGTTYRAPSLRMPPRRAISRPRSSRVEGKGLNSSAAAASVTMGLVLPC